jgi:hypothetical protein
VVALEGVAAVAEDGCNDVVGLADEFAREKLSLAFETIEFGQAGSLFAVLLQCRTRAALLHMVVVAGQFAGVFGQEVVEGPNDLGQVNSSSAEWDSISSCLFL